eukprot:4267593-Prymnesium_polylepis.1
MSFGRGETQTGGHMGQRLKHAGNRGFSFPNGKILQPNQIRIHHPPTIPTARRRRLGLAASSGC